MKNNIKLMNLNSFTGEITSYQDYINSSKYIKHKDKNNIINISKQFPKISLLDLPWINDKTSDYDSYIIKPKEIIYEEIINFEDDDYFEDYSDDDLNTDNSYFYDENI